MLIADFSGVLHKKTKNEAKTMYPRGLEAFIYFAWHSKKS